MTTEDKHNSPQIPPEEETGLHLGFMPLNWKFFWFVVTILVAFAMVVIAVNAHKGRVGEALAVLLVVTYIAGVIAPEGMTPLTKLYISVKHKTRKMMGLKVYRKMLPEEGESLDPQRFDEELPLWIKDVGLIDPIAVAFSEGELGVLHDADEGTYSIQIDLDVSPDPNNVHSFIAGFANMLEWCVRNKRKVRALSWSIQTLQGELISAEPLLENSGNAVSIQVLQEILKRRIVDMGEASTNCRCTITLTLIEGYIGNLSKMRQVTVDRLIDALTSFHSQLMSKGGEGIGLERSRILTYNEVLIEGRLALDPVFAQGFWEKHVLTGRASRLRLSRYWMYPSYANFEDEDVCRVGTTYKSSFSVRGFPANGVKPEDLETILRAPCEKTLAVTFGFPKPKHAIRRARWSLTGVKSAVNTRQRRGQLVRGVDKERLRVRDESEDVLSRSSYNDIRCTVHVSVHGKSSQEVKKGAKALVNLCENDGLFLEPCSGGQEEGVVATGLLVSRGLPQWKILESIP